MENKSILDVEESVQNVLEALPSIVRSRQSAQMIRKIGEALQVLAPAGYHPVVELQENGRRKRRTASAENWNPETGEILISFSKGSASEPAQRFAPEPPAQRYPTEPRTRRLPDIRDQHASSIADKQAARSRRAREAAPPQSTRPSTVNRVEKAVPAALFQDTQVLDLCHALEDVERQGRAFVALKWFRDEVLPSTGYSWASELEQRQAVLADAIKKGLIVTNRIPNPRSPYPTTAIRLNRSRLPDQGEAKRYSPVHIHGEPLSSTILRDRGTH